MKTPFRNPPDSTHKTVDEAPNERAAEGIDLTDEDEEILDRVWRDVGKGWSSDKKGDA